MTGLVVVLDRNTQQSKLPDFLRMAKNWHELRVGV